MLKLKFNVRRFIIWYGKRIRSPTEICSTPSVLVKSSLWKAVQNQKNIQNWRSKTLQSDPDAEFDTRDIWKVRHSVCGEWKRVKEPYDATRWRSMWENARRRRRLSKHQAISAWAGSMWSHNVLHSLIVLINLIPIPVTSPSTYTSNHIFLYACYDMVLWDRFRAVVSKWKGWESWLRMCRLRKNMGKLYQVIINLLQVPDNVELN